MNKFLARVGTPSIRSRRELLHYVTRTTLICVALAVVLDVINQMVFFIDWETSIRSWIVTVGVATTVAVPVLFLIGRAYLQLYNAKLAVDELSRTDPLTGLLNRRALLEQAEDGPFGALALVIVDIDRFKRINDVHGHLAGDSVIRTVGQAMAAELGDLGRVGRLGGEEFALVSTSNAENHLIDRLWAFRDRIAANPIVTSGASIQVTISAGVACRTDGQSFDELYAEADRALYLAKASGRNRIVSAAAAMHVPAERGTAARAEEGGAAGLRKSK